MLVLVQIFAWGKFCRGWCVFHCPATWDVPSGCTSSPKGRRSPSPALLWLNFGPHRLVLAYYLPVTVYVSAHQGHCIDIA